MSKKRSKKLKVAYVVRGPFGAAGTNASYMFPSIVNEKHDVLVIDPNSEAKNCNIVYDDPNLHVERLKHHTGVERMAETCMHLQKFNPDIVHIFDPVENLLLPFFAKRFLTHRPKWLCDVRSPLLAKRKKRKIKAIFRGLTLQRYLDHISSPVLSSIDTIFPICWKPKSILPFGVDLDVFPKRKTKTLKTVQKFVFIGSVARRRKIPFLIEAFAELIKRSPKKITLDIFGDGNAMPGIQERIAELKVGKYITCHGAIPQQELFEKLHSYDVGLGYIPYEFYTDSPPLKTIEYAGAGLPIFASDTNANKSFAKDEGFKIHLFENTIEGFCKKGLELIENGYQKKDLDANLKTVKTYDWNNLVEKRLLPIYDKMMSE